ncbi:Helix-turn-helix domain [Desulfitobacterium hafniense]|uniref:Helix-turn-helix domain n=1 Tax=Desulfitobacterium hafniense TaxID=49338 RepID=A0A098AYR2_DESHA|nr:Helix-turn-helix domain [Desulfitobacterium hafniense]
MIKFDAITIGKNVTARREYLGMSMDELAQRTGIPARNIKAIEAGERKSYVVLLARITWGTGSHNRGISDGRARKKHRNLIGACHIYGDGDI